MDDNIGTLLAGWLSSGSTSPKQPARLLRAYKRAHREDSGDRPDAALRAALIAASADGAYDDPDSGRLKFVFEAWRAGVTPKDFKHELHQIYRVRLRRRTAT